MPLPINGAPAPTPATSPSAPDAGSPDKLNEVLSQFAASTLQGGSSMVGNAMQQLFQKDEEDDEDDTEEPL